MRPHGHTSGLGSGALTRIAGGVQTTFADPSNLPSLLLAVAAPDLLDPKSAAQNSKPRLSFSTKPTVLASRVESDTTINVMKWKTVSTIFLVVVLYLIIGATVFKALEQPHEISQRTTIVIQKQTFISQHACVNSTELDELIQVRHPGVVTLFSVRGRQVRRGSNSASACGVLFPFLLSLGLFGHRFFFLVSCFLSLLLLPLYFSVLLLLLIPSCPCVSLLLSCCHLPSFRLPCLGTASECPCTWVTLLEALKVRGPLLAEKLGFDE